MTSVVIWTVAGILTVYALLGIALHRRDKRRRATGLYVGPDTLRLLQDLDADLDSYATAIAPYYEAGLDRLRNTINDHRGDQ